MEGSGAVQIITDPDADPGGTKTYGSGSGILPGIRKVLSRYEFRQTFFSVSIFSTRFFIQKNAHLYEYSSIEINSNCV
jgi:hypothetical protein